MRVEGPPRAAERGVANPEEPQLFETHWHFMGGPWDSFGSSKPKFKGEGAAASILVQVCSVMVGVLRVQQTEGRLPVSVEPRTLAGPLRNRKGPGKILSQIATGIRDRDTGLEPGLWELTRSFKPNQSQIVDVPCPDSSCSSPWGASEEP